MESDTTLWDLLMSDLKQWAEQEQPVVCSSPVAPTVSEVEQSPQTVGEALNTERSWFLPQFFFFLFLQHFRFTFFQEAWTQEMFLAKAFNYRCSVNQIFFFFFTTMVFPV